MVAFDLASNINAAQSIAPAAQTGNATGGGVDLQGYESAAVHIPVGAYTDGTHTIEVQESDDDASYGAVADADLLGSEPVIDGAGKATTVHEVGYVGNKRYLRVISTVAGATSGAEYGATVVRGHPHLGPA